MTNIVTISHELLKQKIQPGNTVLDGTVGMGNDTLFLANLVSSNGHVYGFDIQAVAITEATKKLKAQQLADRVTLFHASHADIEKYLSEKSFLDAAIFNLGYLPKGDKQRITTPTSTLPAIKATLKRLKPKGLLLIASYIGHPGGMEEYHALYDYLAEIDQQAYHVGYFEFINQKHHPPRLFIIERR